MEIKFDHSKDTLDAVLGVSKERLSELWEKTRVSLWEIQNPALGGYSDAHIFEAFVKHSETPAEMLMQTIAAHRFAETEKDNEFFEQMEDLRKPVY